MALTFNTSGTQSLITKSQLKYWWQYIGGRSPSSYLKIASSQPFNFTVCKEGAFAKFAKAFGFTQEYQTHDDTFDNRFYIYSDDQPFWNLLQNPTFRQAITRIFNNGFNRLYVEKGMLVLRSTYPTSSPDEEVMEIVVADLYTIHQMLAATIPDETSGRSNQMFFMSRIATGAFYTLAFCGFFGCVVLSNYVLLSKQILVNMTLATGSVICVVILLFLRIMFGNSSRGVTVFGHFLTAGVIGTYLSSYAALDELNMIRDTSQPVTHDERIISRSISYDRHNNPTYYLIVPDWRGGGQITIHTNENTYYHTHSGQTIRLISRAGYFNCEWIQYYTPGN